MTKNNIPLDWTIQTLQSPPISVTKSLFEKCRKNTIFILIYNLSAFFYFCLVFILVETMSALSTLTFFITFPRLKTTIIYEHNNIKIF